jgi:hypothetical protein
MVKPILVPGRILPHWADVGFNLMRVTSVPGSLGSGSNQTRLDTFVVEPSRSLRKSICEC